MAKAKSNPIQQASQLANVTYIIPLTAAEARKLADGIKGHLTEMDAQILELKERDGWKALGYTSWRACIQTEFDISQSRGYQLLAAAKVRQNLSQLPPENSNNVGKTPNSRQAAELSKLKTADEQQKAWQQAVETAPGHQPTAKQVASIVRQSYAPVTRPAPKPGSGKRTGASGRPGDTRTRCKALLDRASERLVEEVYGWLADRLGEPVETGEFAG